MIRRSFPELLSLLKQIWDPRDLRYITYQGQVLLLTKILSSIFYISSMRKTSEEFNCKTMIENIGYLAGQVLEELPYWETINNYLKGVDLGELQEAVCKLVKGLLRNRAFERAKVCGRYWLVIIDGTQLYSSREKLDGKCLYRVHNQGTDREYAEYYYYVLEAKVMLHPDIYVSIMTEFAENQEEAEKQDCERKAFYRLAKRLRKQFPMLPMCICGDRTACMHAAHFSRPAKMRAAGIWCGSRKGVSRVYMGSMRNYGSWRAITRKKNTGYQRRRGMAKKTGKRKKSGMTM